MAAMVTKTQLENLKYLTDYLQTLKIDGLIKDFHQESDDKHTIYIIGVDNKRDIKISTDLTSGYKAVFEGMYEEWTDYLAPGTSFTSLVDWLKNFINAYVNDNYYEVVYTDKKSGAIAYKKLIFKDSTLGRRQLISYTPTHFQIKRLLGHYKKSIYTHTS